MGVASGCGEQEAGVASGSGWNLWVWLLGVVVRRYLYRFPHTTYPYSGWLRLYKIFQEAASPVSDLRFMCHLLNNCSLYMSIIFIYFLSIYIGNN